MVHCVIHTIHIFIFVERQLLGVIVIGFANFDGGTIDGSNITLELGNVYTKGSRFQVAIGHQISLPLTSLMQDATKIISSQTTILLHFYRNAFVHDYVIMFHV
jgi:hypothetical protein